MESTKRKKKYISCNWLEHGIIFDHQNMLRVCCIQSHKGGGRHVLRYCYNGETIDWQEIFDLKNAQREMHREGQIFSACEGCPELEEKYWDSEDYIDKLLLTHWINCDSKCVYCQGIRDGGLFEVNKHYNIIPVIKDMIAKNILKKTARISIAGGEAVIYPEFSELLSLLLDKGYKDIVINSSGTKFDKTIARGLKEGKIKIIISIDAGSKEVHQKVKLVDTFDKTLKNIKWYKKSQKLFKDLVRTKYIIVPGINDIKNEIDMWIKINKNLKLKTAYLDLDILWYKDNLSNIPESIVNLIEYTKKQARRNNLKLVFIERALEVHKKYHSGLNIWGKLRDLIS